MSSAAAGWTGRGSPHQYPAASSGLQSCSHTVPVGSLQPCCKTETVIRISFIGQVCSLLSLQKSKKQDVRSNEVTKCALLAGWSKASEERRSSVYLYWGFRGLLSTSRSLLMISGASSFCPIRRSSAIMHRTWVMKETNVFFSQNEHHLNSIRRMRCPTLPVPGGRGKPVLWFQTWRRHTGRCRQAAEAPQASPMLTK